MTVWNGYPENERTKPHEGVSEKRGEKIAPHGEGEGHTLQERKKPRVSRRCRRRASHRAKKAVTKPLELNGHQMELFLGLGLTKGDVEHQGKKSGGLTVGPVTFFHASREKAFARYEKLLTYG